MASSNKHWQPAPALPTRPPAPIRKNTIPGTWLTLTPAADANADSSAATTASANSPTSPQTTATQFLNNDEPKISGSPSRDLCVDPPMDDMRKPLKTSVDAIVGGDAAERREVNSASGRAVVDA